MTSDAAGSLLETTKYEAALQDYLHVKPPSALDKAGVNLFFDRERRIPLPWSDILADLTVTGGTTTPIRQYFERSWGLSDSPAKDDDAKRLGEFLVALPQDGATFVTLTFATKSEKAKVSVEGTDLEGDVVPTGIDAVPQQVTEGLVIADGYGRHYVCTTEGAVGADEFATLDAYETFWRRKLESVEICFKVEDPAAVPPGTTQVEHVDLRARAILEAYDELVALRDFDDKLQGSIDDATKDKLVNAVAMLNIEEIDKLQQSVTSLKLRRFDIKRRLERLVQRAGELGYLLFLEDRKGLKFPDGTTRPTIAAGELYRQFRREYRWTTTIDRVECTARQGLRKVTSFFGIESPEPRRWKEKKSHAQTIIDVRRVDVNEDPLTDRINELGKTHSVYVFAQTPNGYCTSDDVPLRDIMFRCERDEAFRQQCAVFIPVVERSVTGRTIVSGYNAFLAPLPGIAPTDFPRLSVQESLSYRMVWKETCLGEVANVVNLAPGESRSITVRRSYEQETVYSERRTSVLDLQESETSDIATEVERQMERTNEAGWNLSVSSSASAPVGGSGVSASASRSFGYNQSLKSFSKSINKAVRKASQAINRRVRDEVTTDTRQTTRVSNFDEYTSTISNINEGRTLNLVFYKLRNRFDCGLFLEDLRFRVTPSVEIIAGSGLKDVVTFEVGDLDAMLDEFSLARLPVDMDETNELRYWRLVTGELDRILQTEYAKPKGRMTSGRGTPTTAMAINFDPPAPGESENLMKAVESEKDLREKQRQARKDQDKLAARLLELTRENFDKARDSLKHRLDGISLIGQQIHGQVDDVIELVAPGLYVDAIVGSVPSTEAYSERMREQTIETKMAEVALKRADARYRLSLAGRMGEGGNWIVGVMPYKERNALMLGLRAPLSPGEWRLVIDGEDVGAVPADEAGNYMVTVTVDDAALLSDDGLMSRRVELRNAEEGRVVTRFPAAVTS
ncbi:MAG: hypothetical protein WB783_19010 [Arenicellales bacterium]